MHGICNFHYIVMWQQNFYIYILYACNIIRYLCLFMHMRMYIHITSYIYIYVCVYDETTCDNTYGIMIGFFVLDSLMLRRLIIHTSITQNEQEIHLQSSTYSNMHISHYRLVIYIYVYLFKKKRSMGFQQSEYENFTRIWKK